MILFCHFTLSFHLLWIISLLLASVGKIQGMESNEIWTNTSRHLQGISVTTYGIHHETLLNRGYLMCACDRVRSGVLRTHFQLRHVWKSNLPIAIGHCDELSESFILFLKVLDPTIIIINICPSNMKFPYKRALYRRLRGYFCKPAALIFSPFNNTMLLDTDTIWFSSPEKLFDSEYYTKTGTLFFRDKFVDMGWGNFPNVDFYGQYFQANGYHWPTKEQAYEMLIAGGMSLFWGQHAFPGKFPKLGHYQDSSCTIINRGMHPKLFDQLEMRLFNDNPGFGDKEMFWTSALLGKESHRFEPFLVSMNGDCDILLLHWNPHDSTLPDISKAQPLYMNGEYMLEDIRFIGDLLRFELTIPVLASEILTNQSKALVPFWVPEKPRGEGYDCVCGKGYTCKRIPNHVYHINILMQWVSLSTKLSGDESESDCIPINYKHIDALNHVFTKKLKSKDCPLVGCPIIPIEISPKMNITVNKGIFCDPVSFQIQPTETQRMLALKARGFI